MQFWVVIFKHAPWLVKIKDHDPKFIFMRWLEKAVFFVVIFYTPFCQRISRGSAVSLYSG